MAGLLDSFFPTAGMTAEELAKVGERVETAVPNGVKGLLGSALGAPADIANLGLLGAQGINYARGHEAVPELLRNTANAFMGQPAPNESFDAIRSQMRPYTSDGIAESLGADLSDPVTQAGLLGDTQ